MANHDMPFPMPDLDFLRFFIFFLLSHRRDNASFCYRVVGMRAQPLVSAFSKIRSSRKRVAPLGGATTILSES